MLWAVEKSFNKKSCHLEATLATPSEQLLCLNQTRLTFLMSQVDVEGFTSASTVFQVYWHQLNFRAIYGVPRCDQCLAHWAGSVERMQCWIMLWKTQVHVHLFLHTTQFKLSWTSTVGLQNVWLDAWDDCFFRGGARYVSVSFHLWHWNCPLDFNSGYLECLLSQIISLAVLQVSSDSVLWTHYVTLLPQWP